MPCKYDSIQLRCFAIRNTNVCFLQQNKNMNRLLLIGEVIKTQVLNTCQASIIIVPGSRSVYIFILVRSLLFTKRKWKIQQNSDSLSLIYAHTSDPSGLFFTSVRKTQIQTRNRKKKERMKADWMNESSNQQEKTRTAARANQIS